MKYFIIFLQKVIFRIFILLDFIYFLNSFLNDDNNDHHPFDLHTLCSNGGQHRFLFIIPYKKLINYTPLWNA